MLQILVDDSRGYEFSIRASRADGSEFDSLPGPVNVSIIIKVVIYRTIFLRFKLENHVHVLIISVTYKYKKNIMCQSDFYKQSQIQ